MAYNKQIWDTTSYVNPTRLNHMEEGIYNASIKADTIGNTSDLPSPSRSVAQNISDINNNLTNIFKRSFTATTLLDNINASGTFSLPQSILNFDYISVSLSATDTYPQAKLLPSNIWLLSDYQTISDYPVEGSSTDLRFWIYARLGFTSNNTLRVLNFKSGAGSGNAKITIKGYKFANPTMLTAPNMEE